MATAFNTQGATPALMPSGATFSMSGSTPAAKALNNAGNPFQPATNQYVPTPLPGGAVQKQLPANSFLGSGFNTSTATTANSTTSGLLPPTNQPVKSHTVNNVDGSSVSQTYHPPANTAVADTQPIASTPTPPLVNPNSAIQTNTGNAPQGTPSPTNASFSGLVNNAATSAQGNTAIGQNAADIAARYGQEYADVGRKGANAESGYLTTGTSPVAEGNAAVQVQNTAAQQQAIAQGETAALKGTAQQLTGQNQQTTGLINTANLAPEALRYGMFGGGGANGLDPQTQANQLADLVSSGQLDYTTAESQMGQYGAIGTPALRNAILAKNPNFNFNLSASSAKTQATGQQIQTAADSTNKALDTLSSSFDALPGWQTGTIPAGNSIAQWIGSQLGDKALTQYKTNLADARSQLIGVLNSSGGTPTGNESTAEQYLPDNMTPAQFTQNVGTPQNPGIVRQLINQKVSSFTQSGQQNQSVPTQNGGSLYSF